MKKEEKQAYFNAFIEEYKEKTLKEKQAIAIKELKELIAVSEKVCLDKKIKYDLLVNREILDINKQEYTQDDYIEAIYVYIQIFKEIISSYLLKEYPEESK